MKQSQLIVLVYLNSDSIGYIVHLICLLIAKHHGLLQYF
ncbi:UNVERIFIED_ORG: hypothetical protein M2154_000679 [Enterobacter sp. JUb101]|nr:hypothetical protein [Lelliottia amnigena]